jgi:hypothetical protein
VEQLKCKTTSLNNLMLVLLHAYILSVSEVSGDVCRNAGVSGWLNWLSFFLRLFRFGSLLS